MSLTHLLHGSISLRLPLFRIWNWFVGWEIQLCGQQGLQRPRRCRWWLRVCEPAREHGWERMLSVPSEVKRQHTCSHFTHLRVLSSEPYVEDPGGLWTKVLWYMDRQMFHIGETGNPEKYYKWTTWRNHWLGFTRCVLMAVSYRVCEGQIAGHCQVHSSVEVIDEVLTWWGTLALQAGPCWGGKLALALCPCHQRTFGVCSCNLNNNINMQ